LIGLALAAGLGLAGCGDEAGFDSDDYCRALAEQAPLVDSQAMLVDGDPAALQQALDIYLTLQGYAPTELTEQWALIVRDLESMVSAARGGIRPSEVDFTGFSDAFTQIEQDRRKRCGDESTSPSSGSE
jgi:hypothetical protein